MSLENLHFTQFISHLIVLFSPMNLDNYNIPRLTKTAQNMDEFEVLSSFQRHVIGQQQIYVKGGILRFTNQ